MCDTWARKLRAPPGSVGFDVAHRHGGGAAHDPEKARARERAAEVFAEADPVRRLEAAAGWLTNLYSADFDVVIIFEAATDESPETRDLLRAKLAGRNEVMDAMIASLDDHLAVPVAEAQAVYRALAASGVYRELVYDSGWTQQQFQRWLTDALQRHLFGTTPAAQGRPVRATNR